jgi:hypothetical protein
MLKSKTIKTHFYTIIQIIIFTVESGKTSCKYIYFIANFFTYFEIESLYVSEVQEFVSLKYSSIEMIKLFAFYHNCK